ncbi:MAG: hypothetical protein M1816_004565 [Peltula sp. TS41687]|nr:MAG: hypothetical protein M1816_004565 [Peltula sp. TS41687]
MATRRAPLSNLPNAVNSPCRGAVLASTAVSKRSRSHSTVQQHDIPSADAPPAKKQMLKKDYPEPRTPPRPRQIQPAESHAFPSRRTGNTQITTLERKLMAAREKKHQATMEEKAIRAEMEERERDRKVERSTRIQMEKDRVEEELEQKAIKESIENVRQWQRHYRKVFPSFVFYFESLPEDVRAKCSKQIALLGAREVKFFSKGVTHVVTTRTIPSEPEPVVTVDTDHHPTSTYRTRSQREQSNTINPSLLQRNAESINPSDMTSIPTNSKFPLETSSLATARLNRNGHGHHFGVETRRQQPGSVDVLFKAREMGMKIWALEKLQRMITALFEDATDTSLYPTHSHNTRSNAANIAVAGPTTLNREAQLSRLLREERLNGPTDRDPSVRTKELIPFKGPHIYVRDMDEKFKPIMVREYPNPENREDGAWPQFRSVGKGKCPFVEEVDYGRREDEKQKGREEDERVKREPQGNIAHRTRAAVANEAMKMATPPHAAADHAVAEVGKQVEPVVKDHHETRAAEPTKPTSVAVEDKEGASSNVYMQPQPHPIRFFRGEPEASGVQPSNITSAIRSQMISSTAAGPGAKAGTTKEVYSLQRKILEKNGASIPVRQTGNVLAPAAAIRANMNPRVAKLRAQQKLGLFEGNNPLGKVEEEEGEEEGQVLVKPTQALPPKTKSVVAATKKDPKPGYCENCREKFHDFDEHIASRNHRKFAMNDRNFVELDALLLKLARPLKDRSESAVISSSYEEEEEVEEVKEVVEVEE